MKKVFKWFGKQEENLEVQVSLPKDEEAKFLLKVDDIRVAVLSCKAGEWYFKYTEDFKSYSDEYNYIVGFPDLNRIYQSPILWPFFQVRIPGLKQPAVQEILKKENIDQENEVALLKRFGAKTITNPYELVVA